jgi:hypothetical protein
MYGWKVWRDTRARFLLLLALLTLVAAVSVLQTFMLEKKTRAAFHGVEIPGRVGELWAATGRVFQLGWGTLLLVASLALGTFGVGEERKQGTLDFLLTRPRSPAYFVWVGWGVGVLEVLAMVCAGTLASFLTLCFLTQNLFSWRFLTSALILWTAGIVVFGLTYFLTIVLESPRDGLSLSLLLLFGHVLVTVVTEQMFGFRSPSLLDFLGKTDWIIGEAAVFPAGSLAGWLAVGLFWPAFAVYVFQRREA